MHSLSFPFPICLGFLSLFSIVIHIFCTPKSSFLSCNPHHSHTVHRPRDNCLCRLIYMSTRECWDNALRVHERKFRWVTIFLQNRSSIHNFFIHRIQATVVILLKFNNFYYIYYENVVLKPIISHPCLCPTICSTNDRRFTQIQNTLMTVNR